MVCLFRSTKSQTKFPDFRDVHCEVDWCVRRARIVISDPFPDQKVVRSTRLLNYNVVPRILTLIRPEPVKYIVANLIIIHFRLHLYSLRRRDVKVPYFITL